MSAQSWAGRGVRLEYERLGEAGDPVTLVHGSLDDRRTWTTVAPKLATALEVLLYDRREHGGSSGPDRERPVADDALDLADLLEGTGAYPTHLVADGYGGAVALKLAVERPELVRSVVVHAPLFLELLPPEVRAVPPETWLGILRERHEPPSVDEVAQGYLAAFGSPREQWSAWTPATRRRFAENVPALVRELRDASATDVPAADLAEVPVPVLVTVGAEAPAVLRQVVDQLCHRLPNANAVTLPGTGHLVQLTDPDLLVGVVGTFLLERNVPST